MKIPATTSTFTFDTTNRHRSIRSNDCVIRAISLALGKEWEEVFDALTQIARRKGRMPNDEHVFFEYLEENGWVRQRMLKKEDNTRYTAKEFVREIAQGRVCILSTRKHLTCCMADGRIHDTWDCGEWTVGNWWIKR